MLFIKFIKLVHLVNSVNSFKKNRLKRFYVKIIMKNLNSLESP